jgi:hypothetical protein
MSLVPLSELDVLGLDPHEFGGELFEFGIESFEVLLIVLLEDFDVSFLGLQMICELLLLTLELRGVKFNPISLFYSDIFFGC